MKKEQIIKKKSNLKGGNVIMKFVKGMIIGSAISVGMMVMYSEGMFNKKKMKQMVKKISF